MRGLPSGSTMLMRWASSSSNFITRGAAAAGSTSCLHTTTASPQVTAAFHTTKSRAIRRGNTATAESCPYCVRSHAAIAAIALSRSATGQ